MVRHMKGDEGTLFLADYEALKTATNGSPDWLEANWRDRLDLQEICDRLDRYRRKFELAEEWTHLSYTPHVPAKAAKARREFEEYWQSIVSQVAMRNMLFLLDELLDGIEIDDDQNDVSDSLGLDIQGWKNQAKDDAGNIEHAMAYLSERRESDEFGDFEWLGDVEESWLKLMRVVGLDLKGAFWRRNALPHILFPSHVSAQYGVARASIYRRLVNAGRAFTFGAPLAALAMQRAVLEELLRKHWGADERMIESANLPELSWDSRAHRLKRLANEALHNDPEKLAPDDLDRAIIDNFLLLRILIENAPEDLCQRGSPRL